MEEQGAVEVGGAAVRRDAQCDRLFLVVVVVGLGVVIAVLVVIAMIVVMVAVLVVTVAVMRAVLVGVIVLPGPIVVVAVVVVVRSGGPGHQVGVDVRMIAARMAMDHDAVRRDDHGGSEDRRQHRGEAGRHPFPRYETRLDDGWVATV
jgi:hypothetical protein